MWSVGKEHELGVNVSGEWTCVRFVLILETSDRVLTSSLKAAE